MEDFIWSYKYREEISEKKVTDFNLISQIYNTDHAGIDSKIQILMESRKVQTWEKIPEYTKMLKSFRSESKSLDAVLLSLYWPTKAQKAQVRKSKYSAKKNAKHFREMLDKCKQGTHLESTKVRTPKNTPSLKVLIIRSSRRKSDLFWWIKREKRRKRRSNGHD